MLPASAHEVLADGPVTAGPAFGTHIITAGYPGDYRTIVTMPGRPPRVWGRYRDKDAALYGDEAARAWAAELLELPPVDSAAGMPPVDRELR
jgi:hypothetical protein